MQPIRITSEKPWENKEVGPVKPVQMKILKMKRLSLATFRRAKNSREEAKEGQQFYLPSFFLFFIPRRYAMFIWKFTIVV